MTPPVKGPSRGVALPAVERVHITAGPSVEMYETEAERHPEMIVRIILHPTEVSISETIEVL